MENNENIVRVNCNWCGKEIECPENMLDKVEKHMCFTCFKKSGDEIKPEYVESGKVHIDIPTKEFAEEMPNIIASAFVEKVFPELWKEHKEEIKEMSKKEIAREMFGFGIEVAVDYFIRAEEEEEIEQSKTDDYLHLSTHAKNSSEEK